MMNLVCIMASYFSIFLEMCNYPDFINISNYTYPTKEDKDFYYVALIGTNDMHGYSFSRELYYNDEKYFSGGISILASYIHILRGEWGNRVAWLDAGDKFQGALEDKITNGTLMIDFFKEEKVQLNAIGNHEFDFGETFLSDTLYYFPSPFLAANIIFDDAHAEYQNRIKSAAIIQMGEIKVGVIGLTTVQTPFTTDGNVTDLEFVEYKEVVEKYSKKLKEKGAQAIVLLSHFGVLCDPFNTQAKMNLNLWNISSPQSECNKNGETSQLLHSLENGTVDAVIGGHFHEVAHHWINGVPVIQSLDKGLYFNVIYLPFRKTETGFTLSKENILIEGPIPICEKIFSKQKRCEYKSKSSEWEKLQQFYFHQKFLNKDEHIEKLLRKWEDKMSPYRSIVGYTDAVLSRVHVKENVLGNFVSDAIRNFTESDICIIVNGNFRATWNPGPIVLEDVYSMFAFRNRIFTFEMNGKEVMKMLKICQEGEMSFYSTSGVRQYLTLSKDFLNATLDDGGLIEAEKTYTISTYDWLIIDGGDDFRNVVSWYTPRKLKMHGMIIDIVLNYFKYFKTIRETEFLSTDPSKRRIVFQ